jgi:hypothetical protein
LTSVGAAIAHVRYHTFINGVLSGNIQIDTTQVATDTIDYVATDTWGNTATSTRTIIIKAAASSSSVVQ